jgi:hypothetical protein
MINTLPPAELGDAVLAPQTLQHDTNLLIGRVALPDGKANVLHNLIGRRPRLGFLSHLRFSSGATMSQKTSLSQVIQFVSETLTPDSL